MTLTKIGEEAFNAHREWHEKMDGGFLNFFQSMSKEQVEFLFNTLGRVKEFMENILKQK